MNTIELENLLFRDARSQNGWTDEPVEPQQLERLYELLKWGPTSLNASPARFVFLCSEQARQRLKPCLLPGNVDKAMAAPVIVIVAHDLDFHERLPQLFPHNPQVRNLFAGEANAVAAQEAAFRNGTLQGAYLMLAARMIGLDVGPMSGFSNSGVDELFFAGTRVRSNFLCALGRGDGAKLFGRLPRLSFEEACTVL